MKNIVFHVGGPEFHPVEKQAKEIINWLGGGYNYQMFDGLKAFEHLDNCDLLVLMGLHWTGMNEEWAGSLSYQPMQEKHKAAFEKYVASGKPLLAHHGAIASYDDWPRFGELIGFAWRWEITTHSPEGEYIVQIADINHAVTREVNDFTLWDELYYHVQTADAPIQVLASAQWDGEARPMVSVLDGGRVEGAGRSAYLANGHDLRAFEAPAMKQLWCNAVQWLLENR
jgi:type 1 glutamine amidotransferase